MSAKKYINRLYNLAGDNNMECNAAPVWSAHVEVFVDMIRLFIYEKLSTDEIVEF